ncbi:MAG: redoxin domain-containing protein [Ferruginibacter sp.]
MRLFLRKTGIFLGLFIMISLNIRAQNQAQTIPAFKFFKLDKSFFTDQNLESNKLLFFCFFDITCDHCRHAIGKINDHYSEFNKTAIYLITLDNPDAIKNFMSHYGPDLPGKKNVTILQDKQNEFITKFRPVKYPSMFLYSQNKKLLLYDDNEENVFKFLKQIKLSAK